MVSKLQKKAINSKKLEKKKKPEFLGRKVSANILDVDLSQIRSSKRRMLVRKKQSMMKQHLSGMKRLKGETDPEKGPITIEMTREADDTMLTEEVEAETMEDQDMDEFKQYFTEEETPKILITTGYNHIRPKAPSKRLQWFIRDFMKMIPSCEFVRRRSYPLKDIIKFASNRNYTMLIVVAEYNNWPNRMIMCKLPYGPTATFRISSFMHCKFIEQRAETSDYHPEVILNQFNTRLGIRMGRFINALFPHHPEFVGRRVVTFHNQRDFIFVRHHRYQFESKERCYLQEIGPRFTLRLKTLQLGTHDPLFGEYEFFHDKSLDKNKRTFHL